MSSDRESLKQTNLKKIRDYNTLVLKRRKPEPTLLDARDLNNYLRKILFVPGFIRDREVSLQRRGRHALREYITDIIIYIMAR